MQEIGYRQSDAILGAMRQVAVASDHAITYADTVSILAAARYLLRRRDLTDIGLLPAVAPSDLVSAVGTDRALAGEAVKYLAVMALVDGSLEHRKLARVLDYARALDIEADYLTELVEAASGHLAWATADMWRKNFDSVLGRSSVGLAPATWIRPYDGAGADPGLVARYEALGRLRQNTFGKALWDFDKRNGYPFPGDPQALNAGFGTPHDSTHVISGHQRARRAAGLDLHRRHASHQPDERPHPAGDLLLPLRRTAERRRPCREGRARSRRILARLVARRGDDGRRLRARLELLAMGRARPRRAEARLERDAGGHECGESVTARQAMCCRLGAASLCLGLVRRSIPAP